MVMHEGFDVELKLSALLFMLTCFSVLSFTLPVAYADDSVELIDIVNINVPISCSMSSTLTSEHASEVNNGQTVSDIGATNLKVICNDNSGFAIYAIGYTDDTYGKTVLTNPAISSTNDIITSTTITTGTSSWAMKLAAVSGTYAPIIAGSTGDNLKATGDPDFSNYTAVPEEYTKVAYHTASTDTGTNASGSNLTTTYRAYISPSQPAGTYIGQVKYTLVHPADTRRPGIPVNKQIEVTYDANGNGRYFGDDTSVATNVVTYDVTCESENKEYYVSHTSNVDDNGNKLSSLNISEHVDDSITIPGASKLKVVVNYDYILDGSPVDPSMLRICANRSCDEINGVGTQTIIVEGDYVEIDFWGDPYASIDPDHNYGYFAKIYPLDENDEEYTFTEFFNCNWTRTSGEFIQPNSTNGREWFCGWRLAEAGIMETGSENDLLSAMSLASSYQDQFTVKAGWCR